MFKRLGRMLARLHHDQRGAVKLEYLLIIAAISLPLLGVIMWYRDDISRWLGATWDEYRTPGQAHPVTPSPTQGP